MHKARLTHAAVLCALLAALSLASHSCNSTAESARDIESANESLALIAVSRLLDRLLIAYDDSSTFTVRVWIASRDESGHPSRCPRTAAVVAQRIDQSPFFSMSSAQSSQGIQVETDRPFALRSARTNNARILLWIECTERMHSVTAIDVQNEQFVDAARFFPVRPAAEIIEGAD